MIPKKPISTPEPGISLALPPLPQPKPVECTLPYLNRIKPMEIEPEPLPVTPLDEILSGCSLKKSEDNPLPTEPGQKCRHIGKSGDPSYMICLGKELEIVEIVEGLAKVRATGWHVEQVIPVMYLRVIRG